MGTQTTTPTAKSTELALNQALVAGELASEIETRTLPSGSVASSFSLTVRAAGAKTTSVPVTWYDPPKRLSNWGSGDQVVVAGQVVRRFYRGSGGLGSSTEVVVEQAELARHHAKIAKLVERIATRVHALAP